jgi:hypothetical protein
VQADGVKHKRFVIKAKVNYAAPTPGEKTAAVPGKDERVAHAETAKGAGR